MHDDGPVGVGQGVEIAAEQVDVPRLERRAAIVGHAVVEEPLGVDLHVLHRLGPVGVVGEDVVLHHRGAKARPALGWLARPLLAAPQVNDGRQPQVGHPRQIGLAGIGVIGRAIEQAALHGASVGGVIAAEIAEVLDAFEVDVPGHGRGDSRESATEREAAATPDRGAREPTPWRKH